jgi:hypothetical protein
MKGYQLDFYVFVTTKSAALWYKMIKLIGSRELISSYHFRGMEADVHDIHPARIENAGDLGYLYSTMITYTRDIPPPFSLLSSPLPPRSPPLPS